MKQKLLLILSAFLLGNSVSLYAQDTDTGSPLVFSAGKQGGGYWGVATRLRRVAEGQTLDVEVMESVGSLQNLQRLADPDSPVALALTQSDALKSYLKDHPGLNANLEILETIGKECVFIVAGKDSGIEDSDDLQSRESLKMAIRSPESGIAVTFRYMTILEPAFGNIDVVYMDPADALKDIAAGGGESGVGAVMLVQRPKVRSPVIKTVLAQPETFGFVSIEDRDLDDKLPSGKKVYSFMNIPLLREGWTAGLSVRTICTDGLLVAAGDKLSDDQRRGLQHILDYQWMQVYPTDR